MRGQNISGGAKMRAKLARAQARIAEADTAMKAMAVEKVKAFRTSADGSPAGVCGGWPLRATRIPTNTAASIHRRYHRRTHSLLPPLAPMCRR